MADRIPGAPQDTDTNDAEFTHESGSVAFTAPPGDTTEHAESQGADAVAAAEAARAQQTPEQVAAANEEAAELARANGEESASLAAGTKRKVTPVKKTIKGREDALTANINKQTHLLRTTESAVAKAARQLEEINARIAAAGGTVKPEPGTGTAPAKKADAAAEAAKPVRPKHPTYREFDTDEAYEAAVAQWQTDVDTYEQALIGHVEQRLTQTVDTRLSAADRARASQRTQEAFYQRVAGVAAKHENWAELRENIKDLRSSWYDPAAHGAIETPFLSDLAFNHVEDGAEFMAWLGEDADRAQILADLEPSQGIRDGLLALPSMREVMNHFATAEGLAEWEALAEMHPVKAIQRLGALYAHLSADSRGPAATARPITAATLPISHRAGAAGAVSAVKATPAATPSKSFDGWMDEEDQRELADRKRALGISA